MEYGGMIAQRGEQQGGEVEIMDNRMPETGSDRETDNCGDKSIEGVWRWWSWSGRSCR